MKVSVDHAQCYGSAECAYRVPSVFAFEDGYGVVLPGGAEATDAPEVRERVREAAERCPSQAIRLSAEGE
ncbi:ferredoxin [Streptomyces sp. J2-1]|uniref:ferredoxin n=1 Tax=Streptomyces corallincola TaxID=2851888 RepID=UPI001C390145|nr:ferredoxin [Streptomyces corallincola]MBV2357787.1 ferredoxin [Streptomyces corallincola]